MTQGAGWGDGKDDIGPSPAAMEQATDPMLFRLMTERVQDYAIFLLDPSGRIMSWNAGARNIKQYSADEIIGQHFSIFYSPTDIARDWPAQELKRALREGRFEDEGWRIKKDGSRFWANVIITALRDDTGKLVAYSKITRDLSQRKASEEGLRQSEERFRLLVDGVQDYAIYMLSPEGTVTSWNLGACRIKGYEATEIIGKHFSRFYPPEDIDAGKPWIELAVARQHGRVEDEGWRVRKDGSRFWARVVVTTLYDGDGKPRGFAKVTQDLTQRMHGEALEVSGRNVQDFLAVLAHELRNPLAPIRNAVHLHKNTEPLDPLREESLKIIDRQSRQLSRIVEDLLDVTRVARGTLSLERKPCEVARIVERAVETANPAIVAGKHTLHVETSPVRLIISADELRLTQAVTNLLNNAARYTDAGGHIFVKVDASTDAEGHQSVRISVRDTGRGIAPEFIQPMFGMFVQGKDPLSRPTSGLGVGLALARSIVELHHGTLEATSKGSGKGAEFTIRLALLDVVPDVEVTPHRPEQQKNGIPEEATCRVLVVDDNVDAGMMLASLLKSHGYDVHVVHDGSEGLQAFEEFRPEVVLLDIAMPGMNGLEVARRLRERNRRPRPLIIAVTGWGKPEDEARARDAGFDLRLVKPVEEGDLLRAVGTRSRSIH